MRVLIIGGTGFIGPFVVQQLVEQGHTVAVFNRGRSDTKLPEGVQVIRGDRQDLSKYVAQFKKFAPEVVLDMIPFFEKDAQAVVNTFQGLARRTVMISSGDVYQAFGRIHGKEQSPVDLSVITESSPLRTELYLYRGARTGEFFDNYDKIPCERAYLSKPNLLPGTILRLPVVYGPRDNQHRFRSYIDQMVEEVGEIKLQKEWGNFRWTHGYVENIAHAIVCAVTDKRAANRIYNVGEPETRPFRDWVRDVGTQFGWEGEISLVNQDELPESERTDSNLEQPMIFDTSAIRRELGYEEIVPYEEGLRRTIEWERTTDESDLTDIT
ncbi:NAD-dependent epimerase/dehydratase family protein [Tumebacillus sp. ITR2]|uniref:NAD-dependent epimerase/dehydratase family protein n=1 Tax=Tumebacillus amylolyticus TaxID=2801339 RepID=A0ABS1JGZ8_9BACL|nr:NAD-dependent epimerase/dehydratase family protein [Tumebacillus amylolyticus]MBL0389505.1 NAD-dependent epimerase/dehydratase family protein [Tumebacillus amylolyticus]